MEKSRIFCLMLGYLFGNALTAEAVSRFVCGRSVFSIGNGNPGVMNVGETLGTRAGVLTAVGETMKTVLAIWICMRMFPLVGGFESVYAGLGVTLGHCFPAWHSFKGGKGMAPSCVAFVLFTPLWGSLCCALGFLVFLFCGWEAVASFVLIAAYALVLFLQPGMEVTWLALVWSLLVVYKHRQELAAILRGEMPARPFWTWFPKRH